jgi:hypothetical protein
MTLHDDPDDDPLLAAVGRLRTYDVHSRRAERVRMRFHAALRSQERRRLERRSWKRTIGPAIAAGWCAVYLLEVVRRAMVIYGS